MVFWDANNINYFSQTLYILTDLSGTTVTYLDNIIVRSFMYMSVCLQFEIVMSLKLEFLAESLLYYTKFVHHF